MLQSRVVELNAAQEKLGNDEAEYPDPVAAEHPSEWNGARSLLSELQRNRKAEAGMKRLTVLGIAGMSCSALAAGAAFIVANAGSGDTQVTIYNGGFATVKETRTFNLQKGENEVRMSDVTAQLEPDSVVLRDVKKPESIRVLEQNYEANPLGQGHLLLESEGKVLEFEIANTQTGETRIVKGKLIRSSASNSARPSRGGGDADAIVEIDGKITFGLPGKPRFDALDPNALLRPTLLWKLLSDVAGERKVEVSYLTGGLQWEAAYNFVATDDTDAFDVSGWITLTNATGKDLTQAQVKLVAGDVARAVTTSRNDAYSPRMASMKESAATVSERTFEEYHMYTLPRATNLLDRETKQVEFIRAAHVPAKRIYLCDATRPALQQYPYVRGNHDSNALSVATAFEVENTHAAGLGIPLPRGAVKIYRRDIDGRNEFVGEDVIGHTPRDEKIRVFVGNAFDLVGERRQTDTKRTGNSISDESYEIKLRNHKKEAVEIRLVEHLNGWSNWNITARSAEFTKLNANTIEFRVPVAADGETTVTYTVHYSN